MSGNTAEATLKALEKAAAFVRGRKKGFKPRVGIILGSGLSGAAYDQLGRHGAGEEFRPPPGWERQFREGAGGFSFDDIDLSDLFAGMSGRRARRGRAPDAPLPGNDYEAVVRLSFEQAFAGTEVDLELAVLEWDDEGSVRRVPHRVKARIPRGVGDGEKLRVPGKGGQGRNGGPPGDLYLDIEVAPHPENLRMFHDKAAQRMRDFKDIPADAIRGITAPALVIVGDADVIRPEHAVETFRLLPHAQLAVLPGTDHMKVTARTEWLVPMIGEFLDAPAAK